MSSRMFYKALYLVTFTSFSCCVLAQAQDGELSQIKEQLSSMRANIDETSGSDAAEAQLDSVAKKLAEAEARLLERASQQSQDADHC